MPAPVPATSREDFHALIRASGLAISTEQKAELYGALGYIEAMKVRVRGDGQRPREAEPAHIFRAGE
jgi:hypothetical protein